jgi:hypothetical protein
LRSLLGIECWADEYQGGEAPRSPSGGILDDSDDPVAADQKPAVANESSLWCLRSPEQQIIELELGQVTLVAVWLCRVPPLRRIFGHTNSPAVTYPLLYPENVDIDIMSRRRLTFATTNLDL